MSREDLIQMWLMLHLTIRNSPTEGVVVFDLDTYNAICSKVDTALCELGIDRQDRDAYSLGETSA